MSVSRSSSLMTHQYSASHYSTVLHITVTVIISVLYLFLLVQSCELNPLPLCSVMCMSERWLLLILVLAVLRGVLYGRFSMSSCVPGGISSYEHYPDAINIPRVGPSSHLVNPNDSPGYSTFSWRAIAFCLFVLWNKVNMCTEHCVVSMGGAPGPFKPCVVLSYFAIGRSCFPLSTPIILQSHPLSHNDFTN